MARRTAQASIPPTPGAAPPPRWADAQPRYWGTWLGIGTLWALAYAPRALRAALAERLGRISLRYYPNRRHVARVNLALCFPALEPEAREQRIRTNFIAFARSLLDFGVWRWRSPAYLDGFLVRHHPERLAEPLAAGEPVILLTGHTTGLDAAASAIGRRHRAAGLYKPLTKDPVADRLIAETRTRFHGTVYPRAAGFRPLIQALRAGEGVYYVADEDLRMRATPAFVPFFGQIKATIPLLGRLAARTGARVVPCGGILRPDGRYAVHFLPALEGFPTGEATEDSRRMNQGLEDLVRLDPWQYMWTQRLFRTTPDGARSPYQGPVPSPTPAVARDRLPTS